MTGSTDAKSLQDYSKIDAGFTERGLQLWCQRHQVNICHIDFEGNRLLRIAVGIPTRTADGGNCGAFGTREVFGERILLALEGATTSGTAAGTAAAASG